MAPERTFNLGTFCHLEHRNGSLRIWAWRHHLAASPRPEAAQTLSLEKTPLSASGYRAGPVVEAVGVGGGGRPPGRRKAELAESKVGVVPGEAAARRSPGPPALAWPNP